MPHDELTVGCLVRYAETTARWYLGTVHSLADETVTIQFLDGSHEDVDRSQVQSFVSYLRARTRVLSQDRDDLCRVLYGRSFDRLTQPRLEEMQAFLRAHGLRFSPEAWSPGTRIQIRLDASYVAAGTSDIDSDIATLLPRWLDPNRLPPGSRDPLGFQSHAERLANDVLPGLTVFTTRIGYYGFIAWAIQALNDDKQASSTSRRERFHRIERALALCEFVQHGQEDRSCILLGQRSKTQILQTATNNAFRVPERILRNQASAGALRLYATSIESNGFAAQSTEMSADGLLPFQLTDLGKQVASEFRKRVPEGFAQFALSDKAKSRETLRAWGKSLCFSSLGRVKYRDVFLQGFLLGGTREAEARYRTVRLLFARGLLRDEYADAARAAQREDAVAEDDVAAQEDDAVVAGLTNRDVLMRFFREKPSVDNALLQRAAVFELLSLAQTAIFAHVLDAVAASGRATLPGLLASIVDTKDYGKLWSRPIPQAASMAETVHRLEQALFEADAPAVAAAIGGVLLLRLRTDRTFTERAPDLVGTPVMALLDALDTNGSLASGYGNLVQAMVMQHELVSKNKNRQRWCYAEGEIIVKDDIRKVGYGWHSMRFPQLWSLCRDLGLKAKDLTHGY